MSQPRTTAHVQRGHAGNTLVTGPVDALWLIGCHGPPPAGHHRTGRGNTERLWWQYANFATPGKVWRMNNQRTRSAAEHEGRPVASMATLAQTIQSAGAAPTRDPSRAVLVLYWHGVHRVDAQGHHAAPWEQYWGSIESGWEPAWADMDRDPNWNENVLPFHWPRRNENHHYQAVVRALGALTNVSQIHLYGCAMADDLFADSILQFTHDIGRQAAATGGRAKEVWAYSGITVTHAGGREGFYLKIVSDQARRDDRGRSSLQRAAAATPELGAIEHAPNRFRGVALFTSRGLLPGWQVRGKMDGDMAVAQALIAPGGLFGVVEYRSDGTEREHLVDGVPGEYVPL